MLGHDERMWQVEERSHADAHKFVGRVFGTEGSQQHVDRRRVVRRQVLRECARDMPAAIQQLEVVQSASRVPDESAAVEYRMNARDVARQSSHEGRRKKRLQLFSHRVRSKLRACGQAGKRASGQAGKRNGLSVCPSARLPVYPFARLKAADFRSIQPYSHTIAPMKPSTPSHGARAKSGGRKPIGASLFSPTIRPALSTPHRLSPTMRPDATSVPSRTARSGPAVFRARFSYQCDNTAPTTTANVADIGR